MKVVDFLNMAADDALRDRRPSPVIQTDRHTAQLLRATIMAELHCGERDLIISEGDLLFGIVCKFNGIKIIGKG